MSDSPFHDSAKRLVAIGPWAQSTGVVRNAFTGPWYAQGGLAPAEEQMIGVWPLKNPARSLSWAGSPGTPQKVILTAITFRVSSRLSPLTVIP